jgi:hypothetical protein
MKLMNEIKKESGFDINLNISSEKEKATKLKFEPNLNLKRNFIPNLENENEKNVSIDNHQTIINLNQSILLIKYFIFYIYFIKSKLEI